MTGFQPAGNITIEHLTRHEDTIPQLVEWLLAEWGHILPQETPASMAAAYTQRTDPGRIPQTFVALDGDRPVGMASVEPHDMVTRPELTPWLSGVFVLPEYRREGVGSALVEAVVAATAGLGVDTLYLFTPDQMPFYRRMGWRDLETVEYRGVQVVIMSIDLQELR